MKALSARTGGATSIPQIFVDDKYFGDLGTLREYYNISKVKETNP